MPPAGLAGTPEVAAVADLLWFAPGVALLATGLGLLALAGCRRGRHTRGGQLPQPWATHLPPPDSVLTSTEVLPAVRPEVES